MPTQCAWLIGVGRFCIVRGFDPHTVPARPSRTHMSDEWRIDLTAVALRRRRDNRTRACRHGPESAQRVFGVLLALAFVHGPASAADTPKKAAAVPAVESVSEWERALVRDSAVTLHLRSYYLDQKTVPPPGPAAWAAGAALGYQSGWLGNMLRIGLAGYTSQPVWAPADRDGSLLLKPGPEGYSVLGQAYLSLKLWDQVFDRVSAARGRARGQCLRHPDDPADFRRVHPRRQGPRRQLHAGVSREDEAHQ